MRRPRAGSNVEPAPGWLRGPALPALGPVREELARCMDAIGVMLEARPGVGGNGCFPSERRRWCAERWAASRKRCGDRTARASRRAVPLFHCSDAATRVARTIELAVWNL